MPKQIANYKQYNGFVSLSADGERAISVFSEGMVYGVVVWDTKTGQEIKRHPQDESGHVLSISPDGQHALIVNRQEKKRDGMLGRDPDEYDVKTTIIIWNIDQDQSKKRSYSYEANVYGGVFNAIWLDNSHILMVSRTDLMLWDTSFEDNNSEIATFQVDGGSGHYILYDGETIMLCRLGTWNTQDTLFFIKPFTWEMVRNREILQQGLYQSSYQVKPAPSIVLSPDKQHIAMLLKNQTTLAIRPVNNPNITQTLEVGKKVAVFAWSPDSTKILFAEFDSLGAKEKTRKNRVWIWDIATSEKTLFTELDYDAEYTYGENQDQKAWGIYEISGLQWHGDLIYIVYDRKIQVWKI